MVDPTTPEAIRAKVLREVADTMELEDIVEHPFMGLDEMTAYIRAKADLYEQGVL